LARVPVDAALAVRQWEQYVAAFRSRGWTVIEVEPADAHPDGVFIEDALVVFDLIVVGRAGAATRRGGAIAQLRRLLAAARLDGGRGSGHQSA
jgi:dimethylargininase